MIAARHIAVGLAGVLAAWAAVGLTRPRPIAARLGVSESEVRALALRDLGTIAPLLAAPDPRPAFAMRLLFDATDGLLYSRQRDVVALAAVGSAIDIAGLLAASR